MPKMDKKRSNLLILDHTWLRVFIYTQTRQDIDLYRLFIFVGFVRQTDANTQQFLKPLFSKSYSGMHEINSSVAHYLYRDYNSPYAGCTNKNSQPGVRLGSMIRHGLVALYYILSLNGSVRIHPPKECKILTEFAAHHS